MRATSKVEPLREIGVQTFVGDLLDRASMREGMSGADWVIHAGAELDLGAPAERMAGANVQGSENVASLAWKLGVPRFLSVSSIAYFGGSPEDGGLANEASAPYLPLPTRYSATKHAGERAIQAWAEQGLRVNTVFPSLVYGPPGKKEGSNGLLRQLYLGRFPAMIGARRRTSWVFLDDVVDAMVRILVQAPPGRGYILAGDIASVADVAARVQRLGGAPPPRLSLPPGLAETLLRLTVPLYRLRGRRPPVPPEQVRSVSRHWAFDDTRARTELGWRPRPLDEGLPPTIAMFSGPAATGA